MRAYRMRAMPTPKQMARLRAKWEPYCSVASWYLWRSLELAPEPSRPARAKRTGDTGAVR